MKSFVIRAFSLLKKRTMRLEEAAFGKAGAVYGRILHGIDAPNFLH